MNLTMTISGIFSIIINWKIDKFPHKIIQCGPSALFIRTGHEICGWSD